jgi:hypothetical protein
LIFGESVNVNALVLEQHVEHLRKVCGLAPRRVKSNATHLRLVKQASDVKGSLPGLIDNVDVGTVLEQQSNECSMALCGGLVQRRAVIATITNRRTS